MQYVINVCTTSGNIQEFTFPSSILIQDVKTHIYANHKGIVKTNHNSTHHLIYKGQPLYEHHTLAEYTIPDHSKIYFMSKSNPVDISATSSSFDEYIISPQTNSPSLTSSGLHYMETRLQKEVVSNDISEEKDILLEMHKMMKDIHHKIMNSKHI